MLASSYEVQVRYSEVGPHGFVYHANYYGWYELVQYEFLLKHGYSYRELEKIGVMFTITDIKTKFFAPARLGDRLRVHMYILNANKIKTTVKFIITRADDGVKIAESMALYACVNRNFKPILLSRAMPELHEELKKLSERE